MVHDFEKFEQEAVMYVKRHHQLMDSIQEKKELYVKATRDLQSKNTRWDEVMTGMEARYAPGVLQGVRKLLRQRFSAAYIAQAAQASNP